MACTALHVLNTCIRVSAAAPSACQMLSCVSGCMRCCYAAGKTLAHLLPARTLAGCVCLDVNPRGSLHPPAGKTLAYLLPALTLAVARAEAEWSATTRKTAGQAGTVQVGRCACVALRLWHCACCACGAALVVLCLWPCACGPVLVAACLLCSLSCTKRACGMPWNAPSAAHMSKCRC